MKKIFLLGILSTLFISGCQNSQPPETTTPEPEEVFVTSPTTSQTDQEISFERSTSYSWARLKKYPPEGRDGGESFYIPELVQNAASFVEKDVDQVVADSWYFLAAHLNFPTQDTTEISAEITSHGTLDLLNGSTIHLETAMSPVGYGLAYRVQVDTNALSQGKNNLCLELKKKSTGEKKQFCRTVIKDGNEIQRIREGRELSENEQMMYISPEGYYVKVDGKKYYFDEHVFRVIGPKYAPNKDLIYFSGGLYEGLRTFIFDVKTAELIDDSTGYEAIWKKTAEGYRIYTCYHGYYSQLQYLDLNPKTKEKTVKNLMENDKLAFCDVIDQKKIRSLERIPYKENVFIYREYDINQDKTVYQIDELDMNEYVNVANYLELESENGPQMVTQAVEQYRSTN